MQMSSTAHGQEPGDGPVAAAGERSASQERVRSQDESVTKKRLRGARQRSLGLWAWVFGDFIYFKFFWLPFHR